MSVQAAVAFLNGNDTTPHVKGRGSSNIANRPSLPKATNWATNVKTITTENWNTKAHTLLDSKKDESLTRTKPPAKSESIPVKVTTANSSKPATTTTIATNTSKRTQETSTVLDKHTEELTALYQEVLDNYNLASATITKLEADVEIYACDSTKVRDYEIRVEYLAQKLEQVSEERDLLEQELSAYKEQHQGLASPTFDTGAPIKEQHQQPLSAPIEAITALDNQKSGNVEIIHEQQVDDAYYDEILDAYKEHRSQQNEDNIDIQQKQQHAQMVLMEQMLAEYDQGMKMAMETYVADLEKQRLENKTLRSMVKKQDELIKKLENQCNNSSRPSSTTKPIQQVHLRQDTVIHQSNKPSARTKNTNNGIKQQSMQQRKQRSPSYRSSIDVLEEIAKIDSIPTSFPSSIRPIPSPQPYHYHHQRDTGRSTPPPFAPPRTPLPPLPTSHSNISLNNDPGVMTSTRGSLISYSRSSTSSTSWSSDEQHQHQHHHPLSTIVSALPVPKHNSTDDGNTTYSPLVRPLDNSPSPPTSGSFWKGLKKKF